MDDVTVYQCPECNFNADNLDSLDSHIIEHHSAETHSHALAKTAASRPPAPQQIVSALVENEVPTRAADRSKDLNDHLKLPISQATNEDYENDHMPEDDYEDEDFFNERGQSDIKNSDHIEDQFNYDDDGGDQIMDDEEDFFPSQPKNSFPKTITSPFTDSHRQGKTRPVVNSDNHYERQYACKHCDFFTNNPRAVLYHRKEHHHEKINVHECQYCQYASQYSGKVERHTLLRHKIDIANGQTQLPQVNSTVEDDEEADAGLDESKSVTPLAPGNNGAIINVAKFQCNKCPCKYKRSSDLNKHMRLKHSLNSHQLNVYAECVERNVRLSNGNGVNGHGYSNPDDMENDENDEDADYKYDTSMSDRGGSQNSRNQAFANRNFNQINQKKSVVTDSPTSSATASTSQPTAQPLPRRFPANSIAMSHSNTVSSNPSQLVCPYCTYTADIAQKADYLVHVKDHLCGKTFRCVLCNSVYKYRGDCVVHLKRKHQKADMIAHSYVDKFNLDAIDVTNIFELLKPKQQDEPENEEKLFGCAYCDYKANYKGDVYKHQTRRHPGTMKQVNMLASSNSFNGSNLNGSNVLANCSNQSSGNNSCNNSFNNGAGLFDDVAKYNMTMSGGAINKFYQHTNENGGTYKFYNGHSMNQIGGKNPPYNQMNGSHGYEDDNGYDDQLNDPDMDENGDEAMHNEDDEIDYDEEDIIQEEHGGNDEFGEGDETAPVEDDEDFFNERSQDPSSSTFASSARYSCKFCSFVAKSHGKLKLHLSTHYNLKRYMCPICKRRANFKWDIQKHMRKIHQNFTLEVICLSEAEARNSIENYIESKPYNTGNFDPANNGDAHSEHSSTGETTGVGEFRPSVVIGERKYKCSLCMRTSKWQWDVKKHMRTVHKGQEGEVIVLEGKSLSNAPIRPPLSNGSGSSSVNYASSSASSIVSQQPRQFSPSVNSVNHLNNSSNFMGSDTTGNKKFRCTICPYRSNWKADLYRHLRKRHGMIQPGIDDVIVLSSDEAASTLEEYERIYGVNVRKRARFDAVAAAAAAAAVANTSVDQSNGGLNLDSQPSSADSLMAASESKRMRTTDSSSVISTSTSGSSKHTDPKCANGNGTQENLTGGEEEEGAPADTDMNDSVNNGGVERLPVSIAELNIKPYKCLKCGFRSDRKSDTLRHIRVKHEVDPLHAFKFLRIMSIKEASETIDEYESTRLFRKSTSRVVSRDYALINSLVQQSTSLTTSIKPTVRPSPQNVSITKVVSKAEPRPVSVESPVKTTTTKNPALASIDYFRCPICLFKHRSRLVMKKHLANHYFANDIKTAPLYQCNVCGFKASWQFTVKKHILTNHVSNSNASVVKINSHQHFKTSARKNKHKVISLDQQLSSDMGLNIRLFKKFRPINGSFAAHKSTDTNGHDNHKESDDYQSQNDHTVHDHDEETDYSHSNVNGFNQVERNNLSCSADYGDENIPKKIESIKLVDYEGVEFEATYLVSNGPGTGSSMNATMSFGGVQNSGKKKMFYCDTCPYKTNNYCNLKQHLLQHRFRDGFFKCRYCPYYVSMIRLLKQHEILHGEYVPREGKQIPPPLIHPRLPPLVISSSSSPYSFPVIKTTANV